MSDARQRAWLVDDRWAKAYPLSDTTATIGRGASCTIILRDAAVSREHATVSSEAGGFLLRALGSAGTSVNGTRVGTDWMLQEGDVIEIAFSTLRFTRREPTSEMAVITRDTPTPLDVEAPTRSTIKAAKRPTIIGHSAHAWRRLWRWLTRRPNTE